MVLVVNSALKMSSGKTASQCSHAALSLYLKAKQSPPRRFAFVTTEIDAWIRLGQAKVVLKATDEQQLIELEKRAAEADLLSYLVRDAGRTQILTGSCTCLGIFGKSSQIDDITGSLKLL